MTPSEYWCARGGLLVIASLIAAASPGPIASAGALDILNQHRAKLAIQARERSERFGKIRSESKPMTNTGEGLILPPSTNEVSVTFRFYGPTIDNDLTTFYAFFAKRNPEILNPVAVDEQAVQRRCYYRGTVSPNVSSIWSWSDAEWATKDVIRIHLENQGGLYEEKSGHVTNYGITVAALNAWRGVMQTMDDVRNLTNIDAYSFFEDQYVISPGYDEIRYSGLRAQLISSAIVHGTRHTTKWLQQGLGVAVDGIIGSRTLGAIEDLDSQEVQRRFIESSLRSRGCFTASAASFAYGSLVNYYPINFTSDVLDVLSKTYSKQSIPALEMRPFEKRIYLRDVGKMDPVRLCSNYRIDSAADCVVGVDEESGRSSLIVQGLQADIKLPRDSYQETLTEFLAEIGDPETGSRGFREGRIMILVDAPFEPQSDSYVLELSDQDILVRSRQYSEIADQDSQTFERHLSRLSEFFGERQSRPSDFGPEYYPDILLLDRAFLLDEADQLCVPAALLDEQGYIKRHRDFVELAPSEDTAVEAAECGNNTMPTGTLEDDWKILNEEGHGIFGKGLLVAKPNGQGIIGLLPELKSTKVEIYDLRGSVALTQHLESFVQLKDAPDFGNLIVNISMGGVERTSGQIAELLKYVLDVRHNILFIVAAGQSVDGSAGERLTGNCGLIPACLGNEENVITVAALDTSKSDTGPRRWDKSHFGEVVSVAAPGIGIFSTDLIKKGNMIRDAYSLRDGTSMATVFVTALAAEIWRRNIWMDPSSVKERIIASVGAIDSDKGWRIFGGKDDEIQAGMIYPKFAIADASKTIVLLKASEAVRLGQIKPAFGQRTFKMFQNPFARADDKRKCPMKDLMRITYTGLHRYAAVCRSSRSGGRRSLRFMDGVLTVDRQNRAEPMSCLGEGHCFEFLEDGTQNYMPLRLEDVRDIYFATRH